MTEPKSGAARGIPCGAAVAIWAAAAGLGTSEALAGDVTVSETKRGAAVTGSPGVDNVFLFAGAAPGAVRIVAGAGTTVNGGTETVVALAGRDSLLVSLGEGDDFVSLTGASFPGNLALGGGGGADRIVVSSCEVAGSLVVKQDAGSGEERVEATHVTGKFQLFGGEGGDLVTFSGCTVRGPSKIDVGAGDDTLSASGVQCTRLLDLRGGAGEDQFYLSGCTLDAGTKVRGDAGNDLWYVSSGALYGKSRVDLGDGDDSANVVFTTFDDLQAKGGAGADAFFITQSIYGGKLSLLTGDDDDRATIYGAQFTGFVKMDMGAGNDRVDVFQSLQFQGGALMKGGAGDDVFAMTGVVFEKAATADGGAGADTVQGSGNTFPPKARLLRIETDLLDATD